MNSPIRNKMSLSKKKLEEMQRMVDGPRPRSRRMPATITKPIRIVLRLNGYDFRVYRIKPSGKAYVVEFELFDLKDGEKPDIIDVKKSKFVLSHMVTQRSYAEVKQKLKQIIARNASAAILEIKED